MSRITLDQLDEFGGVLEAITHGDGVKWNQPTENFVPIHFPGNPHFGEEFAYTFTDADVETNVTQPQTYINWTTPSLPVGTYLLLAQVAWRTTNSSTLLRLNLLRDGLPLFTEPQVESLGSNNNQAIAYVNGEGMFTVTTAGPTNFVMTYAREGASGTVYVFNGYIRLFRIA